MDDFELDLPSVTPPETTGRVLDIDAVCLHHPLTDGAPEGDERYAYVCCVDGTTVRLPHSLDEWASETLAVNFDLRATGLPSIFPCRIEFGIRDSGPYAIPAEHGRAPRPSRNPGVPAV
ncbi:hypothetical protein [Nocardia camponoti]|uniref:Uncharacterized protein n=1 Tax=Nocardia camponoti TaxID=1616106 RepID=A0A917Q6Y2_9NOCA|nr:hypothetical protein [Nocardia camponoti]GGK33059.1 hypothetical protein GCM10011591_00890 [Nocardia camponoti]